MKTLIELEALHAAATPGEWKLQLWDDDSGGTLHVGESSGDLAFIDCNDIVLEADCDDYTKSVTPDLRLIVATHNALPALLDCVKGLNDAQEALDVLADVLVDAGREAYAEDAATLAMHLRTLMTVDKEVLSQVNAELTGDTKAQLSGRPSSAQG